MFRKGLSRTFPFSAHALPAFRLSRKLLLDVDGVSDCAAGSDSAVLRTTAHATAHARRPTNTSPHILNGEHRMRVRTGLVLTQPCKQRLAPRLAPHVAPRARSIFVLNSFLFVFLLKKKQFKNYVHLHLQRFGWSPLSPQRRTVGVGWRDELDTRRARVGVRVSAVYSRKSQYANNNQLHHQPE